MSDSESYDPENEHIREHYSLPASDESIYGERSKTKLAEQFKDLLAKNKKEKLSRFMKRVEGDLEKEIETKGLQEVSQTADKIDDLFSKFMTKRAGHDDRINQLWSAIGAEAKQLCEFIQRYKEKTVRQCEALDEGQVGVLRGLRETMVDYDHLSQKLRDGSTK